MDGRRDDVGRPGLLLVLDGPGGVGEQQLLGYGAEAEVVSWLAVLYFRLSSEQITFITLNLYDKSNVSFLPVILLTSLIIFLESLLSKSFVFLVDKVQQVRLTVRLCGKVNNGTSRTSRSGSGIKCSVFVVSLIGTRAKSPRSASNNFLALIRRGSIAHHLSHSVNLLLYGQDLQRIVRVLRVLRVLRFLEV